MMIKINEGSVFTMVTYFLEQPVGHLLPEDQPLDARYLPFKTRSFISF